MIGTSVCLISSRAEHQGSLKPEVTTYRRAPLNTARPAVQITIRVLIAFTHIRRAIVSEHVDLRRFVKEQDAAVRQGYLNGPILWQQGVLCVVIPCGRKALRLLHLDGQATASPCQRLGCRRLLFSGPDNW